jgi:cytochrome c peroxidase
MTVLEITGRHWRKRRSRAMKKLSLFALPLALLVCLAVSAAAFAAEPADAAARGAKLFKDPALGANGKSCATCHQDGRAWEGKPRFPKVGLGGVHTLDQAIQICISNALGAKTLPWDDGRLTDLAFFVDAAYTPKK